jgi:hypothetical protein
MDAIISSAKEILTGLLSAVGAGFALWGAFDVATGFSQHNAAKQEAGIPKVIGGVAVIAIANALIPKIFEFLKFTT